MLAGILGVCVYVCFQNWSRSLGLCVLLLAPVSDLHLGHLPLEVSVTEATQGKSGNTAPGRSPVHSDSLLLLLELCVELRPWLGAIFWPRPSALLYP